MKVGLLLFWKVLIICIISFLLCFSKVLGLFCMFS